MINSLRRGKIEYLEKGKYRYLTAARTKVVAGKLQVTRSGIGFVLQEEGEDIFIPVSGMGKAMNGDLVKTKVLRRRKRSGQP